MATRFSSARPNVVSASTLVGYRVRGSDNEDLGSIEEIMIDPCTGQLTYAVLCLGGTSGFGDELYVIPWRFLRTNPADQALVLGCEVEGLRGAPAFDQFEWPDFGDEQWERELLDYYNHLRRTTVHAGPVASRLQMSQFHGEASSVKT